MVSAAASAVAGAVFGLALAAPPGPMNAVIAEESVVRGWLPGFVAGLGAMTADAAFCGLALLGVVGFIQRAPTVRGVILLAGGLLMLYFAYDAATEAADTFVDDRAVDGGDELDTTGFRKAFVLAITNPYQITFWVTVGVTMLRPGTLDLFAHTPLSGTLGGTLVVSTGSPALLVGFFAGIVVWITGFPATLVTVGRRVDRFAPAIAVGSAAVLALFGVTFLLEAASVLL